jgi:hypothetical protein
MARALLSSCYLMRCKRWLLRLSLPFLSLDNTNLTTDLQEEGGEEEEEKEAAVDVSLLLLRNSVM